MISSGCYEFVAPWCGPFLDAALNLKNAIGIGASLAARPLPHHRAYGSVHGDSAG
jgi:hypothetical protein